MKDGRCRTLRIGVVFIANWTFTSPESSGGWDGKEKNVAVRLNFPWI